MKYIILHNIIVEYKEIEEDSNEDVDGDQPSSATTISKDIKYLDATHIWESNSDRHSISRWKHIWDPTG